MRRGSSLDRTDWSPLGPILVCVWGRGAHGRISLSGLPITIQVPGLLGPCFSGLEGRGHSTLWGDFEGHGLCRVAAGGCAKALQANVLKGWVAFGTVGEPQSKILGAEGSRSFFSIRARKGTSPGSWRSRLGD